MRTWKEFSHIVTMEMITEQQDKLVGQMNELQQLDSDTADQLHREKDESSRMA